MFCTHLHLKNPYEAHKYRLCRDLPFYSNSSLQSCSVVYCVDFGGINPGVLSALYLLHGFLGDCIVILLSVNDNSVLTISTIFHMPLFLIFLLYQTYSTLQQPVHTENLLL